MIPSKLKVAKKQASKSFQLLLKKIQLHLAPGALTHRPFLTPIGKDFERCFYPDNGGKGVVWCIEVSVRKVFAARYDNYTNQFLLPNKHFPIQCNLLLL